MVPLANFCQVLWTLSRDVARPESSFCSADACPRVQPRQAAAGEETDGGR